MSNGKVVIMAHFVVKAGHEKTAEDILREVAKGTRGEPGNDIYDLYGGMDDEGRATLHLFERYKDMAAVEAHRAAPHYKVYRASIQEHLDAPIAAHITTAIDALN